MPEVKALGKWQAAGVKLIRPLFPIGYNLLKFRHERQRAAVLPTGGREQLRAYEQRFYSQQGEDGILREIFFRIGQGDRYFIEFGVEDGSICNSAFLVHRYGWHGLYIEADGAAVASLRLRWLARPDIAVRQEFITKENIVSIFASENVPPEPDLLSIDIDGNDYWVWSALLDSYRPRVVVIEYNAAYAPPTKWVMRYSPEHRWDGTTHFGASLSSLATLGNRLGYALLGTESRGLNAFFLRRDLLKASGLAEATPEEAYHLPRYGALGLRFPYRPGPYVAE